MKQLGSTKKAFLAEIQNLSGDQTYAEAYRFIDSGIKSVEFIWSGPLAPPGTQGRVDKLYFQLPSGMLTSLTMASKLKLEEEVDMETDESKKRDFLQRSTDLVAEMQHLNKISKNKYFSMIQRNIDTIRGITFKISIALNILLALSVSGGGNEGFDASFSEGYDYSNVHIRNGAPQELFYFLSVLVIIGYTLCFVYQMAIRAPLLRAQYLRRRNRLAQQDLGEEGSGTGDLSSPSGATTTTPKSGEKSNETKQEDDDGTSKVPLDIAEKATQVTAEAVKTSGGWFWQILSYVPFLNTALVWIDSLRDRKMRAYAWKLLKTWLPFFQAVAGLMVLVVIIAVSPSSPAHSPAQWSYIVLAIFVATINVFFPTLNTFIMELKTFPNEVRIRHSVCFIQSLSYLTSLTPRNQLNSTPLDLI